MGKLMGRVVVALLVLLVAIQIFRPAKTNPPTDPSRTLTATLPVTPAADAVLRRACRDCHSNDTTWPWYSNLAPMSWVVIDHVNSGRRHFNYSEWARYDQDRARKTLKDICDLSRDHEMPLGSYLWAHDNARLTDPDIRALCDWTQAVLADHWSDQRIRR